MYGLYGIKHHSVEMLPCGTDDAQRTMEDKATQPLDSGRLSFAIYSYPKNDTKEYPNKYSDQIYLNIQIFEYIRHILVHINSKSSCGAENDLNKSWSCLPLAVFEQQIALVMFCK